MSVGAAEIDAVVVGAGVAGLAAALELQAAGREVTVVDPSDRPGGVVRTDHVSGYIVERGPNTVQVKAPMRQLLEAHNLRDALMPARPASRLRFLVRDGALVPVPDSPRGLLRSPLLSRRAKLRLLGEPFVRRRRGPEESVADFVGRRLGREVASGLVGPFLTGVYAGDERQLGARAVFPGLVALEDRFGSLLFGGVASALRRSGPKGLRGSWSGPAGLGPFVRQLAEQLFEPPALGSRVLAVTRGGERYRVDVMSATGEDLALDARLVVIATPAPEAAVLLGGLDGDVSRALQEIRYAPIAGVPLGISPDAVRERIEGFGFLVPREEALPLLGCLFMSRLFPDRAPEGRELLHCMLGGMRDPELAHEPDAVLVARACESLERVLGLRDAPEPLGVARWTRAVPQPGPEHPGRMAWVEARLRDVAPGLALAGAYVAGVSVSDALASGIAAARTLIARAQEAKPG